MKKFSIASLMMVMLMSITACKKDAQIEIQTPVITEQTVEPLATEANFTWTVDFTGKISSVVKIGLKADLSDAVNYGDDTPTSQKDFTATATGLTKTTTYYYSYELWNPGMSYQSDVYSFTTLDEGLATVTTATVTEISSSSAKCGGNVTYDGNYTVTERGVCWSTSHNPTISGSHMSSGAGTGLFTCFITNLEPETQYYVRAYATNSVGTSYGSEMSFTPKVVPTGAFSISGSEQIYFSQGNLQYRASDGKWQFAEHQYDVIGNNNSNISSSYSGWIDLFGWGTSGYNGKNPYMTSTSVSDYGNGNNNIAGTHYDWGIHNAISNGGNQAGLWRTLTTNEWAYVFNTRSTTSGIRYAKACVNNMNGVILLPDDWSSSYYLLTNTNNKGASFSSNKISFSQWDTLEQHGAVFLPAGGYRYGISVDYVGTFGYYWSTSYCSSSYEYGLWFGELGLLPQGDYYRGSGLSVRLVRNAQ